MALQFECRGGFEETGLTVSVTGGEWTLAAATYTAVVPRAHAVGGWRIVRLPLSALRDDQGWPLPGWRAVEKVRIRALVSRGDPPRLARLHCVPDEHGSGNGGRRMGARR